VAVFFIGLALVSAFLCTVAAYGAAFAGEFGLTVMFGIFAASCWGFVAIWWYSGEVPPDGTGMF